ncbi:heavy metal-associated domain, HMA [Artemisia annua]|uniref:Heavy metal-associated domain, HMA n=1 Tax=Artemisia annua TaxID=35608 RepID=A0A2U1KNW8_ARTAN|nr:heavy metal-associated domain, HMA [Artemisia annua]
MAKQPTSGQNNAADNLQTWILRVYIHCEGCKKKVFKVLQSIDGVYKTVIDAKEHKATVTGTVSGETLVQKLQKSGKHAEILPESFKAPAKEPENVAGNQKKKKKQGNNKKGEVMVVDDIEDVKDEKAESEDVAIDGNDAENDETKGEPEDNDNKSDSKDDEDAKDNGGGGKKKKNKKKKKGEKDENKAPTKGDIDDLPTDDLADDEVKEEVKVKNVEASMEQLNLGPQMVYAAPPPYGMAPYVNNNYTPYYPTPGYGVSYNTSYPGAESSYYSPPVYGYAQSHPAGYYPPPPPRSYYPRSAFDDHDDEGEGKGYCAIM